LQRALTRVQDNNRAHTTPTLGAAALALVLLNACAGNGQGLDANGQPVSPDSGTPLPLTADFQSIQDNVFTPICVHCHSGAAAPQGLQLDAAHSYALLVGVPSNESPSIERVAPGDPDSSYIVLKLQGSAGIVGARMPFGGPYLPQATIDVIRQWIAAGAQPSSSTTTGSVFAVTAVSPPDGAKWAQAPAQLVVGFNHEVDASLVNSAALSLERTSGAGTAELTGGLDLHLAPGNPAAVLMVPRQPLAPGTYRLTVHGSGPNPVADVDAQALPADFSAQFTIGAQP
jgi:hypothetical protein